MSKAQYREDPAMLLQNEKSRSNSSFVLDSYSAKFPACGHHRASREHKSVKNNCSREMQKRRLAL